MGCGVLFPRNYECKSDSEEEIEQQGGGQQQQQQQQPGQDQQYYVQIEDLGSDSGDEEDWFNEQVFVQSGVRVQVCKKKNGDHCFYFFPRSSCKQ